MSIIEKAVRRLDARADAAPAEPVPPLRATPTMRAAPAPATATAPAPAAAPSHSADHVIDREHLRALGMVTPDGGRTPVAEEFRAIKRPLLTHAFGQGQARHRNLIMVTSAMPGEGKTFCAINLAISIAMEMDHTVLLVDADVARPALLARLGLHAEAGLLDLLHDDARNVSEVLLRTDIDSLSILPAGTSQHHSTELLASEAMRTLLDEIAERYPERLIIFDSPPLLMTSEARVLASQMGQIVLVVDAENGTRQALDNALRQLAGCANVNLLFNKSSAFLSENQYGNYY